MLHLGAERDQLEEVVKEMPLYKLKQTKGRILT